MTTLFVAAAVIDHDSILRYSSAVVVQFAHGLPKRMAKMMHMEKPRHVEVTGDRDYVVASVTPVYKVKGKPKELPSIFTASLHKEAGGWRITGWAWADL